MKTNDIKKLADDMASIGYEILGVKPLPWSFDSSPRKILNGAYSIKIAPIQEATVAPNDNKN